MTPAASMHTLAEQQALLARKHYEKYEELADRIGIAQLIQLVPASPQDLRNLYAKMDLYFNHIERARWAFQHRAVLHLAWRACLTSWNEDDTVHVLKHVARWYVQHISIHADKGKMYVVCTASMHNCAYMQWFSHYLAAVNYQRHVEYRRGLPCWIMTTTERE
jgi:hypothetical protein